MATIDLRALRDGEFVLHFGGRLNEVDAFTFANSILAFSEALRAINRQLSPSTSIEISIDALGSGSFRARMKKTQKAIISLIKDKAPDIAVGLLVAFIYSKLHDSPETIIVNDDSYIIERGDDRIILPREIYNARQTLKHPEEVDQHISHAFQAMENDPSVTEFGITPNLRDEVPLARVLRESFARLSEPSTPKLDDPNRRVLNERTTLTVLRAVLERSHRKWQFVWNGVRISAAIKDEKFFDALAKHEYTFGQGDTLDVLLAIYQNRDDVSGAYINEAYEVLEVTGHHPGPKQLSFDR